MRIYFLTTTCRQTIKVRRLQGTNWSGSRNRVSTTRGLHSARLVARSVASIESELASLSSSLVSLPIFALIEATRYEFRRVQKIGKSRSRQGGRGGYAKQNLPSKRFIVL